MKTVKTLCLAGLVAFCLGGCNQWEEIKEVPDGLIQAKTCPTLFDSIIDLFPERKNNRNAYPDLFDEKSQTNIIVTEETLVYVTFVAEGANYTNSFGWYSYHKDSPPQKVEDLKLNILFPNVSDNVIEMGARLKLRNRTFSEGTVIGFFLIVQGWQKGLINYNRTTHFTDFAFNEGQHQQHVLFIEKTCGDIVLAFEDISLEIGGDKDFNDIIFTVTDNNEDLETVSFDLSNVVTLPSSGLIF
ncbi:MAG: DUF4114 domain-containing protein [Cyclobacteriaceae bacterium]